MKNWIITLFVLLTCNFTALNLAAEGIPLQQFAPIANPENPYDEIGLMHNAGLNAVMSLKSFPCVDAVDRYEAYMDFVKERYPEVNYSFEKMGRLFDETSYFVQLSPEKAVSELVNRGRISDDNAVYLQQLYEKLFAYARDGQSPEAFASALTTFENELMALTDAEFNQPEHENEISLILANSAIARYSYAYWYAVDQDENNGWNTILDGGCGPWSGDDVDGGIQARGGKFWKKVVKIWTDTMAFFTSDCDEDFLPEIICRFASAGSASASCCK